MQIMLVYIFLYLRLLISERLLTP